MDNKNLMESCYDKHMNFMMMADMCKKMYECYMAQAKYHHGMYMHHCKGTPMPEKPMYMMDCNMQNMSMMPMNMMNMGMNM